MSLDIAIRLLKAKPVKPGKYTIITDPSISGLIAHEAFGHGVEMDMFVKNRAKAKTMSVNMLLHHWLICMMVQQVVFLQLPISLMMMELKHIIPRSSRRASCRPVYPILKCNGTWK